jgi:hypothetical protein
VLCRPPSRAGKLRRAVSVDAVDAVDASQPVPPAVPKRKQAQSSAASSSQWLAQVMRSAHA